MGLETVIRPVVSPDFRPQPRRVLPPSDENGITIDGGTSQLVNLSHNANYSWSHTVEREVERTYSVFRIHNPDDNEQFVDDEVITKMKRVGIDGSITKIKYGIPDEGDNVELLDSGRKRGFDVAGFQVSSSTGE